MITIENISETRPSLPTACFENGRINEDGSKQLTFKRYVHSNKRKRKQIVAESGRLTYVGQNYGLHAENTSSACKYYVGVLNKTTGKLKICDTEIFHMKPKLESDEPETIFEEKPDLSAKERSNLLISDFGSSKKKKSMESKLKFHVGEDELKNAMKTATDEIFQDETVVNQLNASVVETEDNTMPPCNQEATSVEDVYKLRDIISNIEMEEITNEARIFYESDRKQVAEWIKEEKYHKYILSHLLCLPVQEDKRWLKCKKLFYLNYMLTFQGIRAKGLRKKEPLPDDWPSAVKDRLLAMFTLKAEDRNTYIRCIPVRLKDKLISYILVLTLLIDDYNVDMDELMVDLRTGIKSLSQRFRLLGCVVKSQKTKEGKTTHLATLKLPLNFPKERKVITKKKK